MDTYTCTCGQYLCTCFHYETYDPTAPLQSMPSQPIPLQNPPNNSRDRTLLLERPLMQPSAILGELRKDFNQGISCLREEFLQGIQQNTRLIKEVASLAQCMDKLRQDMMELEKRMNVALEFEANARGAMEKMLTQVLQFEKVKRECELILGIAPSPDSLGAQGGNGGSPTAAM